MKEEALALADELEHGVWYKNPYTEDKMEEASTMIRRLVERIDLLLTKPLDRTDVYGLAIESGFMLSTQHGQAEHKLMPVTDGDTLMALVRAIEERHGIK